MNIWPRPVQQPHPPVWIPGGGSVETWEWCAEMDYVYCYLSYFGHVLGRDTMRGFWERIEQLGLDDNPYRAGFLQFVGVADTDAEAMRLYGSAAEYFYHRCLHVYGGFADPPGYRTEATLRAQASSAVREAARRAAHGLPTWEEMVEMGYVVVGSPDTVREQLDHVARDLRVGHLMVLLQFGNMHPDLVRYNTELFAEKVAPGLRTVWDGYDDRWWPAVAPPRRPAPADAAEPDVTDVLYLHGLWGNPALSPALVALEAARDDLTVVAPTLPGFDGASGWEAPPDHLGWLALVWDVLDSLGVLPCPVVGASVGGMLAAELAIFRPEAVTRPGPPRPARHLGPGAGRRRRVRRPGRGSDAGHVRRRGARPRSASSSAIAVRARPTSPGPSPRSRPPR